MTFKLKRILCLSLVVVLLFSSTLAFISYNLISSYSKRARADSSTVLTSGTISSNTPSEYKNAHPFSIFAFCSIETPDNPNQFIIFLGYENRTNQTISLSKSQVFPRPNEKNKNLDSNLQDIGQNVLLNLRNRKA
jgi:hypothetical protein